MRGTLPVMAMFAMLLGETPAKAEALEGLAAPSTSLTALGGKTWDVPAAARRHKATIVNFWATWCAPCVKELPEIGRLHREQQAAGLAFFAINAGERPPAVTRFVARVGAGYPVLVDPAKAAMRAWGVNGLPVTFILDAKGIVRHRIDRETSHAELRRLVAPLLAGK